MRVWGLGFRVQSRRFNNPTPKPLTLNPKPSFMFFQLIWHKYLFTPLLNALFFFYQGPAFENLGLAVIYLTAALRILLLPFSIISERNKDSKAMLEKQMADIERECQNDSVLKKERLRELFNKHNVNPWAKTMLLGAQFLVLVLLYQVFLGGINFQKFQSLYSWVNTPDYINTNFLGWDIAERNLGWALAVALILFAEIFWEQRKEKATLRNADVVYRYLFPTASFLVLWSLPMVKSLFVLTSLMFSFMIIAMRLLAELVED